LRIYLESFIYSLCTETRGYLEPPEFIEIKLNLYKAIIRGICIEIDDITAYDGYLNLELSTPSPRHKKNFSCLICHTAPEPQSLVYILDIIKLASY